MAKSKSTYKRPPFPIRWKWERQFGFRILGWEHDFSGIPPKHCRACAKPVAGRRRFWCSNRCEMSFWARYETVHFTKRHVFTRDGSKCRNCGKKAQKPIVPSGPNYPNPRALELDHIIPLHQGGTHDPNNLQMLCKKCHKDKNKAEAKFRAEKRTIK